MDSATQLLVLAIAVAVGVLSLLVTLRRQRRDREDLTRESPYATSTEGQKRCPSCGAYNAWTDRNCVNCHRKLPG